MGTLSAWRLRIVELAAGVVEVAVLIRRLIQNQNFNLWSKDSFNVDFEVILSRFLNEFYNFGDNLFSNLLFYLEAVSIPAT